MFSFRSMPSIETLGDAFTHSVTVHAWCAQGPFVNEMKRGRECAWNAELDMQTLVATRGRRFPIARLAERIKCPRCGSDRMRVLFRFPDNADERRGRLDGWGQVA